jgi:APA family basic amino acid/polyamine antiporter
LWGWVEFWIIRSASLAALATIFTASLGDILSNSVFEEAVGLTTGSAVPSFWLQRGLTVAVILGLALVNVLGVRWGGGLQLCITTVKVASLLAILALPFVVAALAPPGSDVARPRTENLRPMWPASWDQLSFANFASALLAVLWAYHGWMNIGPVAEEVSRPQRNIPVALLCGTGIIIFLYLGANLSYYLVLPSAEMAAMKDKTVATEFSLRLLGPAGAAAASAAVMCSVFGALNGNLLVGPRLLYAMGEDGLAPRALGAVHPQFRTPALAIVVMAVWAALLVLGVAALTESGLLSEDKDHFSILTDFAMFGAVIFETMAVTTIFVFRRRFPDADRPYRCWGYPVVPALYLVLPAMILGSMFFRQQTEALVGVGFIALGVAVYYLIAHRQGECRPA